MLLVNLDISGLLQLRDNLEPVIRDVMAKAGMRLSAATHAHILEEANKKLHSRRQMFVDHLTFFEAERGTWVINLDRSARWIDDGLSRHSMVEDLLKSKKTKTSADGSRYLSIPFEHGPGKGKTNSTQAQQSLTDTIKGEFKKRGIPFGKIETDGAGQAKLGTLHSINITRAPLKTAEGPGQGWGPVGSVKQGPTGIPFLQGIRVMQHKMKDAKTGKDTVKRSIMTFRTVSSKMIGSERWVHPGLEPANLLDEGYKWALQEWETHVSGDVLAEVVARL